MQAQLLFPFNQMSVSLYITEKIVKDDGPTPAIEYFHPHINDNYEASPDFFVGTLKDAVDA